MKNNNNFSNFPFFLLRTPLLPFNILNDIFNEKDQETILNKLKELFRNKILIEAIFIASPILYSEVKKWLNNPEELSPKESQRIQNSLLKYLVRMSSRCTPFGLFAGCCVGEFSNKTNIYLEEASQNYFHTRLDMTFLAKLAKEISSDIRIRNELKFFPNNTIYLVGDQIHLIDYEYKNNRKIHHISSVDYSDYIKDIINLSSKGTTIKELVNIIRKKDKEIEEYEAEEFVIELINEQVLVSELEPNLTGNPFMENILNRLKEIPGAKLFYSILLNVQTELSKLNSLKNETNLNCYDKIIENLTALNISFDLGELFQVDMVKEAKVCQLDNKIAEEIINIIPFLLKMSTQPSKTHLTNFIEEFKERYDTKEVPLVEVLDPEIGIGYLRNFKYDFNPFTDDININNVQFINEMEWNHHKKFLIKKYFEAIKNKDFEIALKDEDLINDKETDLKNLPDTFSAMVNISMIDGVSRIQIQHIGGLGAANLLGRFAQIDEKINNITNQIVEKEQLMNPEKFFAEIVHLPESRMGNILTRPILSGYEITYLGNSILEEKFQIPVTDLYIFVRENRIVLWSKKLNKEILPRLTSAHNFSFNSLPVYHFLCDLQGQNKITDLGFDWSFLNNEFNFFPRVKYKGIILSPAKWKLKRLDFEHLLNINNDEELISKIDSFREKWNIPKMVSVADGDNELVIDLGNLYWSKVFINLIKKRYEINLLEFFYTDTNSIVKGNSGNFVNQIILPFFKIKNSDDPQVEPYKQISNEKYPEKTKRNFILGEEWLYYKFYLGNQVADKLIIERLLPFIKKLKENNIIDAWFFVRYYDPKPHLRVRFHNNNKGFINKLIPDLNKLLLPFIDNGLINKVQTDTYIREIERYGAITIEYSEELFHWDSELIANVLTFIKNSSNDNSKWLIGLRIVDEYLKNFGLNDLEKETFVRKNKEAFGKEFNATVHTNRVLSDKFRNNRNKINKFMSNNLFEDSNFYYIGEILNSTFSNNKKAIIKIKEIVPHPLFLDLISSYIHMSVNRFFNSNQRKSEFIIYDFLSRYYNSQNNQKKYKNESLKNYIK